MIHAEIAKSTITADVDPPSANAAQGDTGRSPCRVRLRGKPIIGRPTGNKTRPGTEQQIDWSGLRRPVAQYQVAIPA
jgi:hypothetical protein